MSGEAPKPWSVRIAEARERGGRFTTKDVMDAADWRSCACGQLSERISRGCANAPLDRFLHDLGCDFLEQILRHDVDAAERTLGQIHRREADLLLLMDASEAEP